MGTPGRKRQLIRQIYTARRRAGDVVVVLRGLSPALMRDAVRQGLMRQALASVDGAGLMTAGRYIPQWVRSTFLAESFMKPTKACPVVLREIDALEVLGFEHPLAGLQLVKGGIEIGETPPQAAERELREEAGVKGRALLDLGIWESGHEGELWCLQLCRVAPDLPDRWTHHTLDDGGHEFEILLATFARGARCALASRLPKAAVALERHDP